MWRDEGNLSRHSLGRQLPLSWVKKEMPAQGYLQHAACTRMFARSPRSFFTRGGWSRAPRTRNSGSTPTIRSVARVCALPPSSTLGTKTSRPKRSKESPLWSMTCCDPGQLGRARMEKRVPSRWRTLSLPNILCSPWGCHCPNQTGSGNSWTCSSLVNEIRAGTRVQRSTVRRQISRVRAEATRSALDLGFRRPVVRSGGAVPRPAVAPRPIPFPAAESLVAPASPCPTKDVFSIGDNNRNTN
jgi:hypothetical protein